MNNNFGGNKPSSSYNQQQTSKAWDKWDNGGDRGGGFDNKENSNQWGGQDSKQKLVSSQSDKWGNQETDEGTFDVNQKEN